ncbi:hypothetical protein [Pseudonocardia sp. GCM10023141]|uniref:hypothetical protein n=1 Tax=Pseudonocardia sp. GCM10023141 TaxID=3252653 RepID=UPI00361322EA
MHSSSTTPSPAVHARLRRIHLLFRAALSVLLLLFLVVIGLVAAGIATGRPGAVGPVAPLVVAVLLAVPIQRRRRRPAAWTLCAAALALPIGVACVLAVAPAPGPVAAALLATLLPVGLVAAAAHLAGRASPTDAGALPFDVVAAIRTGRRPRPRRPIVDNATLTFADIVVTVRAGRTGAAQFSIALARIRGMAVREATERDGPWLSIPGEPAVLPPAGAVLVVYDDRHTYLLPVHDPAGFAATVSTRVALVQGTVVT